MKKRQNNDLINLEKKPGTAQYANPPLTTIHVPMEEMGRTCARVLAERIRGDSGASQADYSSFRAGSAGLCLTKLFSD